MRVLGSAALVLRNEGVIPPDHEGRRTDRAGNVTDGDPQGSTAKVTRLTSSDRSSMMRPEHKVILWVSGNGRRMARGIWGLG